MLDARLRPSDVDTPAMPSPRTWRRAHRRGRRSCGWSPPGVPRSSPPGGSAAFPAGSPAAVSGRGVTAVPRGVLRPSPAAVPQPSRRKSRSRPAGVLRPSPAGYHSRLRRDCRDRPRREFRSRPRRESCGRPCPEFRDRAVPARNRDRAVPAWNPAAILAGRSHDCSAPSALGSRLSALAKEVRETQVRPASRPVPPATPVTAPCGRTVAGVCRRGRRTRRGAGPPRRR